MTKVKLNKATKAITELARQEFSEVEARDLKDVFNEVSFGKIIIAVVNGEIESIKVSKVYKPIVDKGGDKS